LQINGIYCVEVSSRMLVSSSRNFARSWRRSGVASISFFFHTNTSPLPRFSLTLRFPSTTYVGGASKRSPPLGTGVKTAAQSPRRMQTALSYGGIATGRNSAANSRSSVFICCAVNSGIGTGRVVRCGSQPPRYSYAAKQPSNQLLKKTTLPVEPESRAAYRSTHLAKRGSS
jgi:hypothetical protein